LSEIPYPLVRRLLAVETLTADGDGEHVVLQDIVLLYRMGSLSRIAQEKWSDIGAVWAIGWVLRRIRSLLSLVSLRSPNCSPDELGRLSVLGLGPAEIGSSPSFVSFPLAISGHAHSLVCYQRRSMLRRCTLSRRARNSCMLNNKCCCTSASSSCSSPGHTSNVNHHTLGT
jgi:hypothetical protein